MTTQRLTKSFVEKENTPGTYRDDQIPGFCLRITESGVKSFLFVGKPKDYKKTVSVTIGRFGLDWDLSRARDEALKLRQQFRSGRNPNLEKKLARASLHQSYCESTTSITLREAFDDYLKFKTLKPGTTSNYLFVMKHLSDWLARPLDSISKTNVQERFIEIASKTKGGGDGSANNCMRVLRAIFSFASLHYETIYNEARPLINPVPILGRLKLWKNIPRRQSVVQEADLPAWARAVETLDNEVAKDMLIFILFTGMRKSEAASIRWSDINFAQQVLAIKNTKNGHPLSLPLSNFLCELLLRRQKHKEGEFVFPGKHGYFKNIAYHLDKVEEIAGISCMPHDLRRTFMTVATRAGAPEYILKKLVNHRNASDVTQGYLVLDVEDLREWMQKITDRLLRFCRFSSANSQSVELAPNLTGKCR